MPAPTIHLLRPGDPFVRTLARMHVMEWAHLYEAWSEEAAEAEFSSHRADGGLPATLVITEAGDLIGSVSLIDNDCEARPDLNPWLASLYVVPAARGRGHATRLISAAAAHAATAGVRVLHVFTESRRRIFQRNGFAPIDRVFLRGHAIDVLARPLG